MRGERYGSFNPFNRVERREIGAGFDHSKFGIGNGTGGKPLVNIFRLEEPVSIRRRERFDFDRRRYAIWPGRAAVGRKRSLLPPRPFSLSLSEVSTIQVQGRT